MAEQLQQQAALQNADMGMANVMDEARQIANPRRNLKIVLKTWKILADLIYWLT